MNKTIFSIIVAVSLLFTNCTSNGQAKSTPAAAETAGVIHLTNDGFKKLVFNYVNNKEWKYEGDKPCIIDFYASWCKNCEVMDHTTFRDPAVQKALESFIVLRVATERPAEEPALGMCQALGVTGLPTYVVVE